jgi:heterodisulfide reductase subunit A-like polyferredoxin
MFIYHPKKLCCKSNIKVKDNDRNSNSSSHNQNNKFKIEKSEEIIIIGGGIVGLTASIYLAKKGRSGTIFE